MKLFPKKTLVYTTSFIVSTFLINLSCNKDVDALRDTVLDSALPVIDKESENLAEVVVEEVELPSEMDSLDVADAIEMENRTAIFYPVHDAYIQNGIGYNEALIRLQEERRTSYLMFDLSPIDSIGGIILSASLEFVISKDDGNGEIDVFQGHSNDWTETELSEKSAPETGIQIGAINQEYRINNTVSIDLDTTYIEPSLSTLVLDHKDGDDLAFSAKEDTSSKGSALVIQYNAPVDSGPISFVEPDVIVDEELSENEPIEEVTGEEVSTEEEVIEKIVEEGLEEEEETGEIVGEEPAEEEVIEEEAAEESTKEKEKTEEDETTEEEVVVDVSDTEPVTTPEEIKNSAPIAILDATPLSGNVPLQVTFIGNNSTDDVSVVNYSWNFKNGKTSNEANPTFTFDEAGSYDVELTVKDEKGLSDSKSVTITVKAKDNEAPIAKLTANLTGGSAPLKVNFDGSSSTDDQKVIKYSWDFKDGSSSNDIEPTHTFEEKGVYDVELTVEDESGLTHKNVISIDVTAEQDEVPVARASASKTSGIIPLEVDFTSTNSTDDNSISSYAWNFKDGNSSDKASASHTFESAGEYLVELTVTDSEGQNNKTTIAIRAEAPTNEAPSAKITTNSKNGTAPLLVNFTSSSSTDDNGITKYEWNFKDGSLSDQRNVQHTFNEPGTYNVELRVEDEKGLSDTETTTIQVEARQNEAPIAKASASRLSGDAPLTVNFKGSDSSDDLAITNYYWDFAGGSSSQADTSYTFNNPGVYNVSFTVTDESGLANTDNLTITVNQAQIGNIDCSTGGGMANESGAKIWCWNNVSIPDYSEMNGPPISNGELKIDSECYEKQVTQEGSRLKFRVDPTNPRTENWCSRDFNMRAEISTLPWKVKQPKGTEEWFGWDYTFGNDYKIDKNNQWLFFQVHPGVTGESPHTELMIIKDGQMIGHDAGEIYVINAANGKDYHPTGITPRAGQKLKIVVHAIWGDSSNGHLQVWINGNKVYDKQVATVYSRYPWGGNAKWGIYKWPWAHADGVQKSLSQGVNHVETYMGTLRIITRKPGDPNYGSDAYSLVASD
ncbi:PKD domain-containing protein [Zobellia alginiliquefaciens]|uniref:PKD domain-containing protein n=1 Tax=Zobellia alginiliquefaciens TaxID=3032586 RepID=UPI0023E46635|nr:PKD domain-containing protein [Zobellia alginiliquefaciens]